MRRLITEVPGFIRSAVRHVIRDAGQSVVDVQTTTYDASKDALQLARGHRHEPIRADLAGGCAGGCPVRQGQAAAALKNTGLLFTYPV
jgi:hypothetical protein